MKSYLARLADRTTLREPSVTPPAQAPGITDPFAATAPLDPDAISALPELPQRQTPRAETPREPGAPTSDAVRIAAPETRTQRIESRTGPSVIQRLVDRTVERHEVERIETLRERLEAPAQPDLTPPTPALEPRASIREDEAPELAPRTLEPPSPATNEEQTLLRKADAFMQQLSERTARAITPATEEAPVEPQTAMTPRSEMPLPLRLQPVQRPSPHLERRGESDAAPSLVIGSLTVEVLPPPATVPPVAPPQQVVIVGGRRGSRSAISSSRRFGLGQF